MRSLHGHSHLCLVVADSERNGKLIHLIVAGGTPVWPLFHYFQARNLDFSTEATYAEAAGLFIDFLAVKACEFAKVGDRSRLLNSFANALLYGTIQDGDDPTGLWWHSRTQQRVNRLVDLVCEISDWLHERYKTTAINPFRRPASVAEQIAFWRRWNTSKAASLLNHTKGREAATESAKVVRAVALPGDVPIVADSAPAFPEEYIESLLFDGFVLSGGQAKNSPWLRWNIRDILITILLHHGGLRVSEPMHLWVDDVFIDPSNPQAARVLVHHPSDGIYEHPDPISGRIISSTRADYLQLKYNRRPLTEATGKRHAGWKNSLLTHRARNAFEVFWFPQSIGELFLSLYRMYLQQVRPFSLNHPYLFVTQDGEPVGVGSFSKNHSSAIRRIGLDPVKDLGTSPHGHRHAYGQRLEKGGLSTKEIQVAMHHVSPLSQKVYTQPSAADVREAIEVATLKLAAAGLPFNSPELLLPPLK
ncbi:Phage integrase family protein [Pseudomonas arsenicoxydans]|uniref:Phage integrase family protein n=1 Tax=Pseudomonas arsenicoxydans TaxID=702115 RepID=A0A1H0QS28_9PSED|nr:gamma-mobile-trio recombinase GmtY [Pseudomonas arsenicoxydans]SDP19516.1 Phage integrase family protein [Pseudomonas arsenicoxydans]